MATAPSRIEAAPNAPQASRSPSRFRSPRLRWAVAAALAVALAAGIAVRRAHLQNAVVYETARVERGSIQAKVTATGTLNAVVDVLVSSQVSGNIKVLYADWNSKVKKGQLVALIDPEIFQAQLDQARATERSAHSAVLTAQAQVEKSRSDLSASTAGEKSAEAVAAKDRAGEVNAKAQWERAESLLREQVMARQDYDTAEANYRAAQAQVSADQAQIDAARQNVQSAQASVQVAQSQLAVAQAQQRQAQAALQQAEVNLVHTRILAPVDGTVVARRMDVGQTVAATLNPPVIFEIAQDLTKMQVDTNVDESDVGNIAVGQTATFVVDAYPDTAFRGVVADIRKAPIINQNVVTYDVVITVANPDFKLFPGMTANVTILTEKLDNTLYVPNSVLRFRPSAALLKKSGLAPPRPDSPQVYMIENGKLKSVPVRFGISDGKFTAVGSRQLQPGAQVVVRASGAAASSASSTPMPTGPRGPRM